MKPRKIPKDQKLRKTKTAILLCLIFSSLVLSVNVWFSEELWPNGYNFFIMLRNTPIVRQIFDRNVYSMPLENLSKPQKIVVTNGAQRSVYVNGNDSFNTLHDILKPFVVQTMRTEDTVSNKIIVSEDEWYNVLRNDELLDTRSVYIDYSIAYTPSLFAHMIGIKDTWISQDISSLKEFVVAPGSKENEMLFYVRDYSKNTIYKYFVAYSAKNDILKAVDSYTKQSDASTPFSFELNLNKNTGGIGTGVVQKVFLNSMITVSTRNVKSSVTKSINPLSDGGVASPALLGAFRYKSGSLRHYTDMAGVEYFVENYSLLKIYPQGLIEYTADNKNMGIEISDDSMTLYESLNRAIEFSEQVWKAAAADAPFNVLVTSDLIESRENDGIYHFTLDYYYEGTPVTVEVSADGFSAMKHAVEIDVQNGKIIKYRHFIRKYEKTDETVTNPSSIEALDKIYANFASAEGETHIDDIFLSYIENGDSSAKAPVWCAKIAGGDETIYKSGK